MSNYRRKTIAETSPNAPGTAIGGTISGIGAIDSLVLVYEQTGAVGGVLDTYLQSSFDGGTTWFDVLHFAQLAAGAPKIVRAWPLSKHNIATAGPIAIGKGTLAAPGVALAAGVALGGPCWGDRIRSVHVAGSGTTAGGAFLLVIAGSTGLTWERGS